jgi:hypothetical protein
MLGHVPGANKMTKYRVTISHDACTSHDIAADNEADAMAAAFDVAGVTLCHQCSKEIELAEPVRAVCVENLDTGETNNDANPDFEVVQLRARVAELEAQLAVRGV